MTTMALLSTPTSSSPLLQTSIQTLPKSRSLISFHFPPSNPKTSKVQLSLFFISRRRRNQFHRHSTITSQLCTQETISLDTSSIVVKEATSEDQLWAAAYLRVRTFFVSRQHEPHEIHDHLRYLAEREFEALKERVAGKRLGFKKVSCINATIPLAWMTSFSEDLCSVSKYSSNGEDRIVIGSLDLNQCVRLPDEITGKRPEGTGSDLARAYLSNVCVAKELQKNGVGSSLVAESKKVAHQWGITDLYVHVAVDNEPAKKLYLKCDFTYENDEPAWQARFLDRPRRILLWTDVSGDSNL